MLIFSLFFTLFWFPPYVLFSIPPLLFILPCCTFLFPFLAALLPLLLNYLNHPGSKVLNLKSRLCFSYLILGSNR